MSCARVDRVHGPGDRGAAHEGLAFAPGACCQDPPQRAQAPVIVLEPSIRWSPPVRLEVVRSPAMSASRTPGPPMPIPMSSVGVARLWAASTLLLSSSDHRMLANRGRAPVIQAPQTYQPYQRLEPRSHGTRRSVPECLALPHRDDRAGTVRNGDRAVVVADAGERHALSNHAVGANVLQCGGVTVVRQRTSTARPPALPST